jgi:hypothetical protein
MGMHKPDQIFINNHELIPKHTLFVDDKRKYRCCTPGLQVWNLQVVKRM